MAISRVRFGHVAFRVANVGRSVKWYADAFGARKVFHGEPQAGRQELMFLEIAPGQHIEIFTNGKEKSQTPTDAIGCQHYCLVVDDIDATIRHLATVSIPSGPCAKDDRIIGSRLSPILTAMSSSSWRFGRNRRFTLTDHNPRGSLTTLPGIGYFNEVDNYMSSISLVD